MGGGPTPPPPHRATIYNPQAIGWGGNPLSTVQQYLPRGGVVAWSDGMLFIYGEDNAGWTLKDYVLPRLASGNIFAEEVE